MIIRHQSNISAKAGNHIYYWFGQPLLARQISATSETIATAGIGSGDEGLIDVSVCPHLVSIGADVSLVDIN